MVRRPMHGNGLVTLVKSGGSGGRGRLVDEVHLLSKLEARML
jgi:hypothetical protein